MIPADVDSGKKRKIFFIVIDWFDFLNDVL